MVRVHEGLEPRPLPALPPQDGSRNRDGLAPTTVSGSESAIERLLRGIFSGDGSSQDPANGGTR